MYTHTNMVIITDPQFIEKEILRRNKRHFRQAGNTPLAGKDVSDKIRFGATTKIANEILERTANIDEITNDPSSKRLLEILKTSKSELGIVVTKDKIMDQYKKWNERTYCNVTFRATLGSLQCIISTI